MRKRMSGLFLVSAAVALVALQEFGPHGLYKFGGHGRALNDVMRGVTWMLFVTHAMLAYIMWQQRREWDHAEAATFRFIGAKGLFWCFAAITAKPQNGINLSTAFLLLLIFATTLDLDFQLIRRYAFRKGGRKADKAAETIDQTP